MKRSPDWFNEAWLPRRDGPKDLTPDEVTKVRALAAGLDGCRTAAKALGVPKMIVAKIVAGVAIKPEQVVLVRDGLARVAFDEESRASRRRRLGG